MVQTNAGAHKTTRFGDQRLTLPERFIPSGIRSLFSGNGGSPEEPTEEESQAPPISTQIKLSDKELERIRLRIDADYQDALDAHQIRLHKCADQEENWRMKVGIPGGEQGESNFRVPIVTALLFAKHAREIDAMFGPKASVSAVPRGPSDTKASKRISIAMSWQFFENMKCIKPIALWALRRLKHGRSFAFVPWETKFYSKYANGQTERVKYQSSPMIYPLGNDEIMLPPDVEGIDTVQDARWVMRKYKTSPTEMLLKDNVPGGEQNPEGDWYQGIAENFEKILAHGRKGIDRFMGSSEDQSKVVADRDEGVMRDMTAGVQEYIEVEEYHIRWRMEVDEEQPGEESTQSPLQGSEALAAEAETVGEMEEGTSGQTEESASSLRPTTFRDEHGVLREKLETQLIIRYIRDLSLICGVQRNAELYPDTPTKIPILDMALLNDGQFWNQGLIELTEEIEVEMSILANKLIEAVGMSIAPPIFVEPTVGENFMNRKYGAYDLIPTANAAGVKQMNISPQTEPFAQLWLLFQQVYEQLTGLSQGVFGRAMDQPNAPRTLGGQRLVAAAGDVRLALDMRMLSEDLKKLLDWVWDLWRMMGDEQEFYRVAEGDAPKGLFEHGDVKDGFAKINAKERQAAYDFSFEFADDMQLREGKKQEMLLIVQALAAMPLFMQNPAAQYRLALALCEVFNIDFSEIMEEPPPLFNPRQSSLEWTMLLQGEDITIHPNDNDQEHITDFENRLVAMAKAPIEDQDWDAMQAAMQHIEDHKQQMVSKQQAQEVMQGLQGLVQTAANALGVKPGGQQGQNPMAQLMGGGAQPPQQPQLQAPAGGMQMGAQPQI